MRITRNASTVSDIQSHLCGCNVVFVPPLSARVSISKYAAKLRARALTIEAWDDTKLVGLVAAYLAIERASCFVTNVSVLPRWSRNGIASTLLAELVTVARQARVEVIALEVSGDSEAALALYRKAGFEDVGDAGGARRLELRLRPD